MSVSNAKAAWRSPSNIAIVKYWGKYGNQYPCNPNISFTLSKAYTDCSFEVSAKKEKGISFDLLFEGKPAPSFHEKIEKLFSKVSGLFPFIQDYHFRIETSNSFPHSAGIASSASAMSAMALCLCSIEETLSGEVKSESDFLRKASTAARIGSGSACRSVYPDLAIWGKSEAVEESSNEYAIPFRDFHPDFKQYCDSILIVSSEKKSVSSTAGHALMDTNPFATARYKQAEDNLTALLAAFRCGDLHAFGTICECEALTLHGLMMNSNPSFLLIKPNTILLIEKIRQYRADTGQALYFTLDAGPNIHLMYPQSIKADVMKFIETDLKPHCENGMIIHDESGPGAFKLI